MKFSVAVASFMAVAASAAPAFLNSNFDVQQGVPFTLKYSGCSSGCTIVLANGDSKDIKDYKTLTSSATGDSFTWTPSDIPSDTYAFKITDNSSGEVNYSSQFSYKGDGVATTSASASASASTTAAVSSTQKSSTAKETTAKETTATPTKSATTLTKVTTTSESVVSTPSQNATTPVSTDASSTKGTKTTAASGTSTAAQTTAVTSVPNSGASQLSSSIALIAGAVMAMVYLN